VLNPLNTNTPYRTNNTDQCLGMFVLGIAMGHGKAGHVDLLSCFVPARPHSVSFSLHGDDAYNACHETGS
jgi:hypothetical protein